MARPEAAMEPSMEEILASIRKIIAEEPAGTARPKPADRAASIAPGRAQASATEPASVTRSKEPDATLRADARQHFGSASSPPDPKPMSRREANPFDKSDPFAPAIAAAHEPQPRSGAAPAAAPLSSPPREQIATPRPTASLTPSADSEMMFGRLAEALRGGPVAGGAGPASAPAIKAPPPTAAPLGRDLDDLDDLLAEPAASDAAGSKSADTGVAPTKNAPAIDFASVFPRRDDRPAVRQAVRDPGSAEPPHKFARAEPFDTTDDARRETAKAAIDEELADILSGDDAEAVGDRGVMTNGTAARHEGVDFIDLHEDAHADAQEPASKASPIESELEDLEGAEAAKSAFGALMAGLAASDISPEASPKEAASTSTLIIKKPAPVSSQPGSGPSSGPAAAGPGTRATPAVSVEAQIVAAKVEAPIPQKPRVVVASLPIAGLSAPTATTPAQTAISNASSRVVGSLDATPTVVSVPLPSSAPNAEPASGAKPTIGLPQVAAAAGLAASLAPAGAAMGVRTVEDIVAELLRPMLREWLAENMPRMVEKALRIELAEGLKTVNQPSGIKAKPD